MFRTRLLWFTLGFSAASAAMGHFIFRDLWLDRKRGTSQVEERFGALETRVTNLEQFYKSNPTIKLQPEKSNFN